MFFNVAFVEQMSVDLSRTIDGAVANFKWLLTGAFEFKVVISVAFTVDGQFSCPMQVALPLGSVTHSI